MDPLSFLKQHCTAVEADHAFAVSLLRWHGALQTCIHTPCDLAILIKICISQRVGHVLESCKSVPGALIVKFWSAGCAQWGEQCMWLLLICISPVCNPSDPRITSCIAELLKGVKTVSCACTSRNHSQCQPSAWLSLVSLLWRRSCLQSYHSGRPQQHKQ